MFDTLKKNPFPISQITHKFSAHMLRKPSLLEEIFLNNMSFKMRKQVPVFHKVRFVEQLLMWHFIKAKV